MPLAFIMEVRLESEETAFLKHFLVRVLKKKKKKSEIYVTGINKERKTYFIKHMQETWSVLVL